MKISQFSLSRTPSDDDSFAMLEGGSDHGQITFDKVADWIYGERDFGNSTVVDKVKKPVDQIESVQDEFSDVDRMLDAGKVFVNSVSEEMISIDDCAYEEPFKLKLNIEPHQDLHGYDHPWVAGAGKNILPRVSSGITQNGITFALQNDGTVLASGKATASAQMGFQFTSTVSGNYYLSGCPANGSLSKYDVYMWDNTSSARAKKWDGSTASVSDFGSGNVEVQLVEGNRYTVTLRIQDTSTTYTNLTFKPMLRLSTETDETFAPYENICPITGYTGVEVTRAGKNLLRNTNSGTRTINGLTFTSNSDGSVLVNGTSTTTVLYDINSATTFNSGNYILSGCPTGGSGSTYQLDIRVGSSVISNGFDYGNGANITLADGTTYRICIRVSSGVTINNVLFKPIIRLASTDEKYSVEFPSGAGTVYGGTLNPLTGELVVDKACITLSGSENIRTSTAVVGRMLVSAPGAKYGSNTQRLIAASHYIATMASGSGSLDYAAFLDTNNPRIAINTVDYSTVDDYKTYLAEQYSAGKPVQFVYELAIPITYTLTPIEVELLIGSNTLWMDADGTISMKYGQDRKSYIDKKIAEIQALILENNG